MTNDDSDEPDVEVTEVGLSSFLGELFDGGESTDRDVSVETSGGGWFTAHEIEIEVEDDRSAETDDTRDEGADRRGFVSSLTSKVTGGDASADAGATSGATPQTGPTPGPSSHSRGTFVFPADEQFMQALEIRAKNGAQRRVETVYALTGPTYTDPSDLFALDDPSYYESATRRSVVTLGGKMATAVARRFPDSETPKLVARFHTHPGGTTTPSDTDENSAETVRDSFEQALGTDDFEFFHGIHAYSELSEPGGRERSPERASNTVSWTGEQYRHTLALYGPRFVNPKEVRIRDEL